MNTLKVSLPSVELKQQALMIIDSNDYKTASNGCKEFTSSQFLLFYLSQNLLILQKLRNRYMFTTPQHLSD